MKELCDCGKVASWCYLPGFSDGSPYFCDDCVHRGCSCNHRYVNVNAYHPPLDEPELPTEEDHPIKWKMAGILSNNLYYFHRIKKPQVEVFLFIFSILTKMISITIYAFIY
jgi:hypothetical protein